MVIVAQIGCGYWGPNLLRNFANLANCQVKYLVDSSPERREYVKMNHPQISVTEDIQKVLDDSEVQALIIATPAGTHFELGRKALDYGKHIFVEKPLAQKVDEVDELIACAARAKRIIMAGHTFIYNNAVRYVKQLIDEGSLGDIRYIYSQRLNLGRIRSDVDALWNLAPHDVSVIQYWLDDLKPERVLRFGMDYIQQGIDDVVFLQIQYAKKVIAGIHVSWLDPQKTRKMVVVGSKKMVIYDDLADDKIAIFDKGIDPKAVLGERMDFDGPPMLSYAYRSGDVLLPKVHNLEPLRTEVQHFIDCIGTGSEPITGAKHARSVVEILERAQAI